MQTIHGISLDAGAIHDLTWEPMGDWPGVTQKILRKDRATRSVAGLMRLEPGARTRPHAHGSAVHHIWVISGDCLADGRRIGPDAYAFVPAGTEHSVSDAGPDGCEIFYLYIRSA